MTSIKKVRRKLLAAAAESDRPLDALTDAERELLLQHAARRLVEKEPAKEELRARLATVAKSFEALPQVYSTRFVLEIGARGRVTARTHRVEKKHEPLSKPMVAFALWARKSKGLSPDKILDAIAKQFDQPWPGKTRAAQKRSLKVALSRAPAELQSIAKVRSVAGVSRWAKKRKGKGYRWLVRAAKKVG